MNNIETEAWKEEKGLMEKGKRDNSVVIAGGKRGVRELNGNGKTQ